MTLSLALRTTRTADLCMGLCVNYTAIFIWLTTLPICLHNNEHTHSLLSPLHQRVINQSLKVASYHLQKIINVCSEQSSPKLMFPKLSQFITPGTLRLLSNTQAQHVQMKVSNDWAHRGPNWWRDRQRECIWLKASKYVFMGQNQ